MYPIKLRTITLLTCFLGMNFLGAGLPSAQGDELSAVMWLEKMAAAQREENYRGTYIYMRGSQFDTMSVQHHFKAGQEYERLLSLTGAAREMVRQDDQAAFLQADDQENLPHPGLRGPFTQQFSENLAVRQEMYQFEVHGIGRIAGRSAVKISITPRNSDRYGYRLWLDQETGLLLRSNLVNQGRVLELFQFTEVSLGDEAMTAELVAEIPSLMAGRQLLPTAPETELAGKTEASAPNWRVAWVPNGFRPVGRSSNEGIVYSDGVASLSIFVEQRGPASLGNVQTSVGGTVVLTRAVQGSTQQITVVGEVPLDTARRVAESIEPVIY